MNGSECVQAPGGRAKVLKQWSALITKDTVPRNRNEKYAIHVKTRKPALW